MDLYFPFTYSKNLSGSILKLRKLTYLNLLDETEVIEALSPIKFHLFCGKFNRLQNIGEKI